jgi:hypothetical protein
MNISYGRGLRLFAAALLILIYSMPASGQG